MNRYGAFSAGDPRPDMPNGQQNVVRPAGQTPLNPGDHFIPLNPFQRGGGPVNFPPGTFTSWLSHNGWSCARWSALTRPQQIQLLGAAMLSGDYSWTTRGNDSYNQQFRQRICLMYPSLCLPTLTPDDLDLGWMLAEKNLVDRKKTRAIVEKYLGLYAGDDFDALCMQADWMKTRQRNN